MTEEKINIGIRYLKMGRDVEFGIMGKNGLVPGCAHLPEKEKSKQHIAPGRPLSYSVYEDGSNGEFGISPDACIAYILDGVKYALKTSVDICKKNGFTLCLEDSSPIDVSAFEKAGTRAWASGCNPTLTALKPGYMREVFDDYASTLITKGSMLGSHIHVEVPGLCDRSPEFHCDMVKLWVQLVLLPMSILTYSKKQTLRYKTLGIGNYRLPKYGIEFKDMGTSVMKSPILYAALNAMTRMSVSLSIDERYGHKLFVATINSKTPFEEVYKALMSGSLTKMKLLWRRQKRLYERFYILDESSPVTSNTVFKPTRLSMLDTLITKTPRLSLKALEEEWDFGGAGTHYLGFESCARKKLT